MFEKSLIYVQSVIKFNCREGLQRQTQADWVNRWHTASFESNQTVFSLKHLLSACNWLFDCKWTSFLLNITFEHFQNKAVNIGRNVKLYLHICYKNTKISLLQGIYWVDHGVHQKDCGLPQLLWHVSFQTLLFILCIDLHENEILLASA